MKSKFSKSRGFSIEYALLAILMVATMVTALLVTAVATTKKAASQRDYMERKACLDASAQKYMKAVEGGTLEASELEAEFNENDFNVRFYVTKDELSAIFNREVILYVAYRTQEGESAPKLIAYRYQYL